MKKFGAILLALLLFVSTLAVCAAAQTPPAGERAEAPSSGETVIKTPPAEEEPFVYEQDFRDPESVNNDFKFYYLTRFGGTLLSEQAYAEENENGHWTVKDGVMSRYGEFDAAEGSGNIAMAFLSVRKFKNFKMTVDIRQGTMTNYWSIFSIRHDECGRHYAADGAAFYFDADGTFKTWGHGFHGGPYLLGEVDGYDQSAWYTYQITVSGNYMVVEVGGVSMTVKMPVMFYRTGYISFMSVNNDMAVRDLRVEALPDSAEVLPDRDPDQTIPAADTEDSLDNLIGGGNA